MVESVKAASDIYAPLSGTIAEHNPALADDPSMVNKTPEAAGWFFRLRLADPTAFAELMDRAAYDAFVEAQS